MGSCIYIDGFALWVVIVLVAALFAGFIFFGNCYIAEARENDRLRREVEQYAAELEELDREREKAEYKDNFLQDIMSLDSETFQERSFKAGFNVGKALGGNGNVQM
ncbi:MAG: hypothetical protein ACI4FN_08455 [Acutalibacteraceae bacterium]